MRLCKCCILMKRYSCSYWRFIEFSILAFWVDCRTIYLKLNCTYSICFEGLLGLVIVSLSGDYGFFLIFLVFFFFLTGIVGLLYLLWPCYPYDGFSWRFGLTCVLLALGACRVNLKGVSSSSVNTLGSLREGDENMLSFELMLISLSIFLPIMMLFFLKKSLWAKEVAITLVLESMQLISVLYLYFEHLLNCHKNNKNAESNNRGDQNQGRSLHWGWIRCTSEHIFLCLKDTEFVTSNKVTYVINCAGS